MNPTLHQADIAALAYHIYEQEGRPEGQSAEHWARAERIVREQRMAVPSEREGASPTAVETPGKMVP